MYLHNIYFAQNLTCIPLFTKDIFLYSPKIYSTYLQRILQENLICVNTFIRQCKTLNHRSINLSGRVRKDSY